MSNLLLLDLRLHYSSSYPAMLAMTKNIFKLADFRVSAVATSLNYKNQDKKRDMYLNFATTELIASNIPHSQGSEVLLLMVLLLFVVRVSIFVQRQL